MMTLRQVAAFFNDVEFTDQNGANPFRAQLLPFEDNVRSGITSTRRILEVDPDVTVPEVIKNTATGQYYITAKGNYDYFQSSVVRVKHPVVYSESPYTVRTAKQLLQGSGGSTIRASVHYNRHEGTEFSSENFGGFQATAQYSFSAPAGSIIFVGSNYYRIIEDSYIDPIGIVTFECNRVVNGLQTLSLVRPGTYDPITETYTGGSTTSIACFVEHREKSFEMLRQDTSKNLAGDMTISTLAACAVGDTIGGYKIIAKRVEDSVNICHCRIA